MSGGYYAASGLCGNTEVGAVTASTTGTTINIGSGAYGAWTQLTASSTVDCTYVTAYASFKSIPSFGCIYALAIGGAGSEVAIASGLVISPFDGSGIFDNWGQSTFPLTIPAGTRISAAAKGNSGDVSKFKLSIYDGVFEHDGIVGYDEIGSVGSLAPSATANTKGSWSQIVASTSQDYVGLLFGADMHGATTNAIYMIDIGIGAAASEIAIIDNIIIAGAVASDPFYIPIEIPAGTRIAARCQTSATSGNPVTRVYLSGGYK